MPSWLRIAAHAAGYGRPGPPIVTPMPAPARRALDRLIRARRGEGPQLPAKDVPPPAPWSLERPMLEYWADRVRQSTRDSYVGVPLGKMPEDLRVYEHLLWLTRADTVIELGAYSGGSALWFRDRLRTFERYGHVRDPRVISIDVDIALAAETLGRVDPEFERDITIVAGDVTDPDLPARIAQLVRPGAHCLVVEDSAHVYQTTFAALKGFARFVPRDGFFVVEDGYVDVEGLKLGPEWNWDGPTGVLPAMHDWLQTPEGRQFEVRRDFELYGITSHPGGFLRRVSGS
jgi:cephalosporin hydroxylase